MRQELYKIKYPFYLKLSKRVNLYIAKRLASFKTVIKISVRTIYSFLSASFFQMSALWGKVAFFASNCKLSMPISVNVNFFIEVLLKYKEHG